VRSQNWPELPSPVPELDIGEVIKNGPLKPASVIAGSGGGPPWLKVGALQSCDRPASGARIDTSIDPTPDVGLSSIVTAGYPDTVPFVKFGTGAR
jgi:hypothetical protein